MSNDDRNKPVEENEELREENQQHDDIPQKHILDAMFFFGNGHWNKDSDDD